MNKAPREYWEEYGYRFRFDYHIEEYEQDPNDEGIGLLLSQDIAKRINERGNGVYSHDYPILWQEGRGIPPIPHDLAAIHLLQCALALQRLADLQERRAAQVTGASGDTAGADGRSPPTGRQAAFKFRGFTPGMTPYVSALAARGR